MEEGDGGPTVGPELSDPGIVALDEDAPALQALVIATSNTVAAERDGRTRTW
jgi:hypothetical protein